MKLFGKDLSKDLVVVAEAGVNHEGSAAAAVKLVKLAKEAGADAIKFQTYTPSRLVSSTRADSLARVSKFRLDEQGHEQVIAEGKRVGIPVFSSAISDDVVLFLAEHFQAIKIASGDVDFEPVIRAAAGQGKPVLLSTGNATIEDVDRAVGWVRDEIGDLPLHERLVLLQCTSSYPAPIEEANVAAIPMLRERYRVPVGFSNHVMGVEACLAAVALGACLLEVHFTDEKEGRTFRDHQLSMTVPELRALIEMAPLIRSALGKAEKTIQPSERGHSLDIRKGLVAARPMAEGEVLKDDDIMYARPATFFRSSQRRELVGRRLKRGLASGALITPEDLA
jgi:N-acetylneuraminate synthase/N,N'-diacetyllegionaminate synthase